ncbi:hypothetical protein ACFX2J_034820 [Malus domestica]
MIRLDWALPSPWERCKPPIPLLSHPSTSLPSPSPLPHLPPSPSPPTTSLGRGIPGK